MRTGAPSATIPARVLQNFLQTLIDALAVGSLYALIALGYTMVYGILKFINFAHSDVFVLGAWVSFASAVSAGWSASRAASPVAPWVWIVLVAVSVAAGLFLLYERVLLPRLGEAARVPRTRAGPLLLLVAGWGWAALGLMFLAMGLKSMGLGVVGGGVILLAAMGTCGLVGFCLERLAYKPLRAAPRLNVLITAIGVSLLLQNIGQLDWMFGTTPQRMPALLPSVVVAEPAGVKVWLVDVVGAASAVLLMLGLDWLVFRTKTGRAMRAVSFSPSYAALMGIPVDRVISFTFILGAMLAAAAGFLYLQKYPAGLGQPASAAWVLLGLKAFVAAVVGGIGNIRGAMLGGLLIGLLEFFGAAYISTALRDLYVFSLLIVVLLVRPSGILGSMTAEKV